MLDRTLPVAGRIELNCEFRNGSLNVQARDGLTEARVAIRPREADLPVEQLFRVELTGSRLDVVEQPEHGGSLLQAVLGGDLRNVRNRMFGRTEVEIVVELPTGSSVKVVAMSASVTTSGRIGPAHVSSGSSNVELDVVDGPLHLRGGSGNLTAHQVAGDANVRSGNGQVRIGEITGALSVAVGSGEVEVGTAHGGVRIRSGSGTTLIDVAERDVDIASSSGQVTIGLRAGQQARLDVATGSGRLHTEMPLQDSGPTGEAITIRARTGSGDVIIRRAATVPN